MSLISDLPLKKIEVPYKDLMYKKSGNRYVVDNSVLSNFYTLSEKIPYIHNINGHRIYYNNIEQLYVASKNPLYIVNQKTLAENIINLSPGQTKRFLQKNHIPVREDWHLKEVAYMAYFINKKFNLSLEKKWLSNKNEKEIIEWNTWDDRRWGISFQKGDEYGIGYNALGLLIILCKQNKINAIYPEKEWCKWQDDLIFEMSKLSDNLW